MKLNIYNNKIKTVLLITMMLSFLLSSGCDITLLNPKGQIAIEQRSLIITAFSVMMIVVIPAIVLSILFAYRYRESNAHAIYNPDWDHSSTIEAVVWIVPILIITFLGILTWKSTHVLEPRHPLTSNINPITIEVVSLDWKWLFIYPEQGIATVNEIAFPVNCPVHFKITSDTVMNSFFIPALGSQMYAMPGMQTQLHLIANEAGTFSGISSNYSGNGFSQMKFQAIATGNVTEFNQWISKAKKSSKILMNMSDFKYLASLKNNYSVQFFSNVKPELFKNIIHQFDSKNKGDIKISDNINTPIRINVHSTHSSRNLESRHHLVTYYK
ncbi:Cytochrome bo(3) ubiquinol oxidase subunit 2 [Candidatus Erwinia haradaeae]|uniref:Ubiquinol oxidase subunit 2 n=1 Tax=Candidatus Erwinia haradaeae TaxID=1922217 RepID=A0A451DL13_9GAMM|nr:ubiquinol oxidase subunit II [Candidatus Erwinia haradaeae]VFP87450.1 Cytochrome bo(3) ubiquinol oxidase subunit 2 [Candidatus Erwinia haradaeae]